MIWVDREVKKIKQRNLPLEWVDDMKTPSGRIHVGALRGVVIHDMVYKVLLENGIKAKFTYIFDDHDPMDAIPAYLNFAKWEKYAGRQLYQIPSPEPGFKNYAQCYAQEFQEVFKSINCHPEIIWASELYRSGRMNSVIKEILDAAPKIREIYHRVSKATKRNDWYPFNVVCEKCQKVGTTHVYKWDGQFVYYRCQPRMVAWARGCGCEGKISPFNGNGKMPWKVEWAAKWKVVGVTIEGAGKDHMSRGGSHDIASVICREILNYPVPYPLPYEWFTIGGKKMSSSKGVGSSAKEVSQILPPDVFRFFMVRIPIEVHLDFNPYGEAILHIFDDYDRCLNAYFDKLENRILKGKQGEVMLDFARIIELSAMQSLPKKRIFVPRFRTIVNLIKAKSDIFNFFTRKKGAQLNNEEKNILEERISFARRYLEKYVQEEEKIVSLSKPSNKIILTSDQRKYLTKLSHRLKQLNTKDREEIQKVIFETMHEGNFSPKEVFKGFYQVLIGRDFGPKAADLILEFGVDKVSRRLREVIN